MIRFLLLPVFALLVYACSKPSTVPQGEGEHFVIGKAYGMCQGDCATFYSIENGIAYTDDMKYFYRTENELKFKTNALPADKYKKIKKLAGQIPQYLIGHPNQTFGCPDCADQGLIYVETKINGVKKHWMIDTRMADIPVEIRSYAEEVVNTLNQL